MKSADRALCSSFMSSDNRCRTGVAGLLSLLTLLWLGPGCASVPDAQFLTRRYTAQAARFKNAWGPVSDRISAAIVNDLKRQAGDLDILDRQVAIEQAVVGKPLVLGNKVTLLQDGPATYRAMFTAIRQAKRTINVEFYIIQDDEVGREF